MSFELENAKSLSTLNWKLETGNSKLYARGFTMFEMILAIAAILLIGTAFLERLSFYQEIAEKAAMESTLRQIKTGLQIRLAELIIANRHGEAAQLETEDPTQWLERRPANFGGSYRERPEGGLWYYDAPRKQLVYVVNSRRHLKLAGPEDSREIRFRARLLKDRVGTVAGPIESVTGVTLAPVYPYRWSATERQGILPLAFVNLSKACV